MTDSIDFPSPPDAAWHAAQRAELSRVGRSLFDRGYVHATAGNLSVRVPAAAGGGFLITPTDACLGFLQAADLVWVGDDGAARSAGRACKSLALHRAIYATDPEAGCVIHTHSTHTVALTLLDAARGGEDLIPPITPYFVMKVGHVPRIRYHRPGDPAAAQEVAEAITRVRGRGLRLRAVMLDRLGPKAWHRTPAEAMAVLEELEETARLWRLAQRRCPSLDEAALEELRQAFGASW